MSENDFSAAYPPKDVGREAQVPPAVSLEPDVRSQPGTPVSSDPIEPLEPIGPFEPIDPPEVTGTDQSSGSGKGQEAKEEAQELAQGGKESAKQVGDTAKREAGAVVDDVKEQGANLLDELGSDVRAQAATQQEKISTNLRQISDELRSMLDSSDASGTASNLVEQAAHHSGNAAEWLGSREPGDLLDEVKDFARRRPGAFLGIALGAGLLAGRITRNAGSGPDKAKKNATSTPNLPEGGEPRTARPLPPTVNQTMGSGGTGGTGTDPGVDYYPSAVRGTEQGYNQP